LLVYVVTVVPIATSDADENRGQSPHELTSICATSATDRQIDFPRSIGPILARRHIGSRLGNYVDSATDRGDTHANRDTAHTTARRPREEASDPADGNIARHGAKDRATDCRIRSASASVQAARRSEHARQHEAGTAKFNDHLRSGIEHPIAQSALKHTDDAHTPGLVRCSRRSPSGRVFSSNTGVHL
jgi:hypothetical protein